MSRESLIPTRSNLSNLENSLNILAVEPFYNGSHKAFLKGLQQHSRHTLHAIKLDYHKWKWRMHGDSVKLAEMASHIKEDIDLLLVNSMTNQIGRAHV